jgi:HPt (histidine-containing phosphotransfer) domain-containing protein
MDPAYRILLDEWVLLPQHGSQEFTMTTSDLLDLTTLQNLVDLDDGGDGLLVEMLTIFREDTPMRISSILDAVTKGQAEELSQAAHALKGGAGALGARALRILAGELENLGREGSTQVGPDLATRLEETFQATLQAMDAYVAKLSQA